MENQTRIGLGGTALGTLAAFGQPFFGWYVSGPIMLVCAAVAVWGFWPIIRKRHRPQKDGSLEEIDLHQFLRFVGIDPMDPMNRLPPSQNNANAAFVKLRQLARDGKVRLRGKPGFKYGFFYVSWKPAELIEPAYWRDAQIFCLDVLGKSDVPNISTMPDEAMAKGKSEADVYKDLTIVKDDVKANFKKGEFSNGGVT
jgi:hypothetical protein